MSLLTVDLGVELGELVVLVGVIRNGSRRTLEPLKTFTYGIGVYDVEVLVQWFE